MFANLWERVLDWPALFLASICAEKDKDNGRPYLKKLGEHFVAAVIRNFQYSRYPVDHSFSAHDVCNTQLCFIHKPLKTGKREREKEAGAWHRIKQWFPVTSHKELVNQLMTRLNNTKCAQNTLLTYLNQITSPSSPARVCEAHLNYNRILFIELKGCFDLRCCCCRKCAADRTIPAWILYTGRPADQPASESPPG